MKPRNLLKINQLSRVNSHPAESYTHAEHFATMIKTQYELFATVPRGEWLDFRIRVRWDYKASWLFLLCSILSRMERKGAFHAGLLLRMK